MSGMNVERDMYNHLMEVMERLEQVEGKLKEEKAERRQEVGTLRKEYREEIRQLNEQHKLEMAEKDKRISELETENALLKEDRARHESNDHNDSNNSSLPPSTDQRPSKPKRANEYNGRTKTSRKSGGQPGHNGKTLRSDEVLQRLQTKGIEPEICSVGKPTKLWKDRLVIDVPLGVKATIYRFYADANGKYRIPQEYENEVTYGNNLKSLAVFLYGQGVQSLERITELLAGLTGNIVLLSQGTVCRWLEKFHTGAESAKTVIESHLLDHHQVSTDGTCVSLNGCQSYIRNFSVKHWALYVPMGSKGHKALSEIPFLKHYAGILMHDHETSLYRYGTDHAECNVHLLRYLLKNTQDTGHVWSRHLSALLVEMNAYRKRLISDGKVEIPTATLLRLESRYDAILAEAALERKEHRCRYNWASKEEIALLNRLKKYKTQHLLFLHDFAVSFDNNMSERDLRKCKNRQKMSGGFRTAHGKEIFCSVLSIIETCKRQSLELLSSIVTVLNGSKLFA